MNVTIRVGDCLDTLRSIPDGFVDCCVTSPPYWGLRDYGVEGQLGLEATPEEYVAKMVAVFREVRRVLRDDGTLWLNLGDCYATGAGKVGDCPGGGAQGERWKKCGPARPQVPDTKNPKAGVPTFQPNRMPIPGLKPKDLVGIPWRVAFALQADGWYLRSDIIWSKPNPMPESVTDRPTKAHEYVFLLSAKERYAYDAEAIADESVDPVGKGRGGSLARVGADKFVAQNAHRGPPPVSNGKANARTVWEITTQPFSQAHFATMPPALAERCVKAGCRVGGTVLDPFGGAGTTGLVAAKLGRDAILCELNPEYARMAERRIVDAVGLLATVEVREEA